jgi:SAM-dependent methyltransferase
MTSLRTIPLTVLAWEGPQARAYLVRLRRAGLQPERILLMVRHPKAVAGQAGAALKVARRVGAAEVAQDRAANFHPYAIRRDHPELVRSITTAMDAVVPDAAGFVDEMFTDFRYDRYGASVERIAVSSYKDPRLVPMLAERKVGLLLFTGGGIVPAPVFAVAGLRVVHVHTGFLPHVRGADVLLWSLLVRGRPGVSAFFMTPGLDDGDVLAARELAPLAIPLDPTRGYDDDTLYRALFSFVDPLIRAELLVADVVSPLGDLAELSGTPQDTTTGITYHFMHPAIRRIALRRLFPTGSTEGGSGGDAVAPPQNDDAPIRYRSFYDKPKARHAVRLALDAAKTTSGRAAVSLRNRHHDYTRIVDDPVRAVLHRELNRHLVAQYEQWPSYDYGEGYFYQSSDELGVSGLRDTTGRVEAFELRERVRDRRVLEIGCNTGFLSLAIAPSAARVVAFELNPHLIAIARVGARYLKVENVEFSVAAFEDFATGEQFDDVLSFANHHTYDGNTRQSLDEYFARCHALTAPGGRLIFESHPPELEGDGLPRTIELIERYYTIESSAVPEYGTFLDRNRRFLVATRR